MSGIIYDFLPYTGKGMITDLTDEERAFGINGQVVIVLYRTLPQNIHATICFEIFFLTIDLLIYLKGPNIDFLGLEKGSFAWLTN